MRRKRFFCAAIICSFMLSTAFAQPVQKPTPPKEDFQRIERLLNLSVDEHKEALIPKLVQMYQSFPHYDKILVNYAMGAYYHAQKNYKKAIARYREVIAENPNLDKVRYLLAQWLYEDKQFEAAKGQFQKLKANHLPPEIKQIVKSYQDALSRQERWDISAQLNFIHDHNINNASSSEYIHLGGAKFKKDVKSLPKKATGIDFLLNINKRKNIYKNHGLLFEDDLSGQYFFNSKDDWEISNKLYLGYQYANATKMINILPFYGKRFVGGKSYSDDFGLSVGADIRLNHQWRLSLTGEYTAMYMNKFEYKVQQLSSSVSAIYASQAKRSISFGVNGLAVYGKTEDQSYHKVGASFGWEQEWVKGFSSRLDFQLGRRVFKGQDTLYEIQRKDTEYVLRLTLWKRDWHVLGLTPKVQYQYKKVVSNIPDFYSYNKSKINLFFSKRF